MSSSQLESTIFALLDARGPGKTICPSEAARALAAPGNPAEWHALMGPVRAAASRLAAAGKIVVTQHGRPVDPQTAKGPIRLRLR